MAPVTLASPAGPFHHAPPAELSSTGRALLSFFRRATSTSRREATRSPSSSADGARTLKKRAPSYSSLDCRISHKIQSTYTPIERAPTSPPPPYSDESVEFGTEEDLMVDNVVASRSPCSGAWSSVDPAPTARALREAEELMRMKEELIREDQRICDELRKLGF
ncbi:hypothetical protein Rhopal_004565-T1 [Rhodotorula paludigena]|uniref:Uncharacterized protein n=1 Tax=Rhodotorula paludigena TaxID=86838 RepID=A0AAV5GQA0_9BASI|nr:hypothetical protein Rhopal_004565-T1 [Rhodotorula paludigena]